MWHALVHVCLYNLSRSCDTAASLPPMLAIQQASLTATTPDLRGRPLLQQTGHHCSPTRSGGEVWNNWIGDPQAAPPRNPKRTMAVGILQTITHQILMQMVESIYCTAMAVLCLEPGYAGLKLSLTECPTVRFACGDQIVRSRIGCRFLALELLNPTAVHVRTR